MERALPRVLPVLPAAGHGDVLHFPAGAGRVPGATSQPGCFPKAPPLPSCPLLSSHFRSLSRFVDFLFYKPRKSKPRSTRGIKKQPRQSRSPGLPLDQSHPNKPSAAPTFLMGAGEGRNNRHRIITGLKMEVLPVDHTALGMRSHSSQGWDKPPMANPGWTQTSVSQGNLGNILQKCLHRPKQFDNFSHCFLCSLSSFFHFTREWWLGEADPEKMTLNLDTNVDHHHPGGPGHSLGLGVPKHSDSGLECTALCRNRHSGASVLHKPHSLHGLRKETFFFCFRM